jgi:5-methylcytosine-specific restriction enzyme A
MTTYLLTWNPDNWHWRNIEDDIQRWKRDGYLDDRWSCGVNTRILPQDRVFLLRQGREPRGIIASGWSRSNVFEDAHWSDPTKAARYIDVRFDVLLDAEHEPIFQRTWLDDEALRRVHWNTQVSGITISDEIAAELEIRWARFLSTQNIVQIQTVEQQLASVEGSDAQNYTEGAPRPFQGNRYERNIQARRACIRHYGLGCFVCGFNFEQTYGDVGIGFIHVHHLKPLSTIGTQYQLDPIKDLRPVCPNCHAMLHRPPYTLSIEELRDKIGASRP